MPRDADGPPPAGPGGPESPDDTFELDLSEKEQALASVSITPGGKKAKDSTHALEEPGAPAPGAAIASSMRMLTPTPLLEPVLAGEGDGEHAGDDPAGILPPPCLARLGGKQAVRVAKEGPLAWSLAPGGKWPVYVRRRALGCPASALELLELARAARRWGSDRLCLSPQGDLDMFFNDMESFVQAGESLTGEPPAPPGTRPDGGPERRAAGAGALGTRPGGAPERRAAGTGAPDGDAGVGASGTTTAPGPAAAAGGASIGAPQGAAAGAGRAGAFVGSSPQAGAGPGLDVTPVGFAPLAGAGAGRAGAFVGSAPLVGAGPGPDGAPVGSAPLAGAGPGLNGAHAGTEAGRAATAGPRDVSHLVDRPGSDGTGTDGERAGPARTVPRRRKGGPALLSRCRGLLFCPNAAVDTMGAAELLLAILREDAPGAKAQLSISIHGCPAGCGFDCGVYEYTDLRIVGRRTGAPVPDQELLALSPRTDRLAEDCPSGALARSPEPGRVLDLDESRCVRCGSCLAADPSFHWPSPQGSYMSLELSGRRIAPPRTFLPPRTLVERSDDPEDLFRKISGLVALFRKDGEKNEILSDFMDRAGLADHFV